MTELTLRRPVTRWLEVTALASIGIASALPALFAVGGFDLSSIAAIVLSVAAFGRATYDSFVKSRDESAKARSEREQQEKLLQSAFDEIRWLRAQLERHGIRPDDGGKHDP